MTAELIVRLRYSAEFAVSHPRGLLYEAANKIEEMMFEYQDGLRVWKWIGLCIVTAALGIGFLLGRL